MVAGSDSPLTMTSHMAGVVPDAGVPAPVTLLGMSPKGGRSTLLDGDHDTPVRMWERGVGLCAIGRTIAAKDLRHAGHMAGHRFAAQIEGVGIGDGKTAATGRGNRSRGLEVEHTLVVAIHR